jgi:hypothetical protein
VNKRKLVWVGNILAVIILASAAACSTPSDDSAPKASSKVAGLNQPARDGKFEFTVKKVDCGKTSIGSQYLNKKAQGQFCLVSVTVKNIGKEPQSLFGDNQYLFDSQNRKFSADTEAAIYLEDSKSLYEEINPGNSLNGVIIYDIPKGASPKKIVLHDSAYSGGVTVNLA